MEELAYLLFVQSKSCLLRFLSKSRSSVGKSVASGRGRVERHRFEREPRPTHYFLSSVPFTYTAWIQCLAT